MALAAVLAVPGASYAASNIENLLFDGQTSTEVRPGARLDAEIVYDITASSHVESVGVEFPNTTLPFQCFNVTDRLLDVNDGRIDLGNLEDINGNSLRAPSVVGTHDVIVSLYGRDGIPVDQECLFGPDDTMTFNDVVSVSENASNNNSTPVGSPAEPSVSDLIKQLISGQKSLTEVIALLTANLTKPAPAPAPVKLYPPAYMGYNRIEVQGWLMTNGYASGFNSVGLYTVQDLMRPGIVWGVISQNAYNQAVVQGSK